MRNGLIIFVCGFVAGAIAVWSVTKIHGVSGNLSTPTPAPSPLELAQRNPHPPPRHEGEHWSERPSSELVSVDQGLPTLPLQGRATNVADMAEMILIQHMHPQLQAALKQYPSLDNKDGRSSLADDVANLVDDDVPIREVVEALGMMFRQERSIEVRIDILNNLLNLDDPSSYQLLVQGTDPNQPQEVRKAAISVLGDYDDSWAVPTLQQLLVDGDAEIRQAAQEALAQKTDPKAGSILTGH